MVFGIITSGLGKIADTLLNPLSLVVEKSARLCAETFNVSDGAMATIKSAPMLYKIMAFGTAVYLVDVYIASRQRAVYRNKDVKLPKMLADIMSDEQFEKSRTYSLDKSVFGLFSGIFSQVKDTGMLVFFVSPMFLSLSKSLLEKYLPNFATSEFAITFVYMVTSGLVEQVISLPFSLYSQFVIEERHGFNKMTYSFYFIDTLKKMAISWAIQAPLTWALIWTIRKTGDYFVIATWAVVFSFSMIMMTIYPAYIAPLFDKYTPLGDGELKTKIEALANILEFPLKKLFVVDGSNRSAHSNAYMYGFRKNKRIVLFDTLIHGYKMADESSNDKGCNDDEICAVLGHELGHWKMGHVWKNLVVMQAVILASFYGFGLVFNNAELFAQFGFDPAEAPPCLIQLMFTLGYFMAPVNEVIGIIMTSFSRFNEYQADEFAINLNKNYGELLKSSLKKLQTDNLGFPVNDPVYSWRHHSHPSTIDRCERLDELYSKMK